MWSQNTTGNLEVTIGNLKSFKDGEDDIDGKEHPTFELADWMAVGLKATVDPNSFDDIEADEIAIYANVWNAAVSQSHFVRQVDLDDEETINASKEHAQSLDGTAPS